MIKDEFDMDKLTRAITRMDPQSEICFETFDTYKFELHYPYYQTEMDFLLFKNSKYGSYDEISMENAGLFGYPYKNIQNEYERIIGDLFQDGI